MKGYIATGVTQAVFERLELVGREDDGSHNERLDNPTLNLG